MGRLSLRPLVERLARTLSPVFVFVLISLDCKQQYCLLVNSCSFKILFGLLVPASLLVIY